MFKKVDKATTFDLEEANKNAKGGNEMFLIHAACIHGSLVVWGGNTCKT